MKKYKWIVIIAVIALAITGYCVVKPKMEVRKMEYTITHVQKGSIEESVSSTGKLEAINTVAVGTQISGTITDIYVDFNDKVTQGQLLATMDIKLLNAALESSKANLAVSSTQLAQAQDQYNRDKLLFEQKVISESEYNKSKFSYEQAQSARKAVAAAVKNAQVNIGYAKITSPINGVVIEKAVDEGQTVAASFSTPTMFIIAEDLSKMQILADVDESDIGYIKDGMPVRFTVQTYPDDVFFGRVSQIRLQPIELNNVVNYQVVIQVDNKDEKLIPGMTANIDFIVEMANNVWLINNSALRFKPSSEQFETLKPLIIERAKAQLPETVKTRFLENTENEELFSSENFRKLLPSEYNGVFIKKEKHGLDFQFIQTGIRTGLQSQIIEFYGVNDISENIAIVTGVKSK